MPHHLFSFFFGNDYFISENTESNSHVLPTCVPVLFHSKKEKVHSFPATTNKRGERESSLIYDHIALFVLFFHSGYAQPNFPFINR